MEVFQNCTVRSPFPDPEKEEVELVRQMLESIGALDARAGAVPSSAIERHPKQLASILKRTNHHFESAMSEWQQWHDFRAANKADSITAETVKDLVAAGVAEWKGADKEGRPCLIVTGRRLVAGVPRIPTLWRQFMIYVAESGLRTVLDLQTKREDEVRGGETSPIERGDGAPSSSSSSSSSSPGSCCGEIVVIYDRRGLMFENIDINLYRDCQNTLSDVRRFYSDRLHRFYVLYLTWGHWAMYWLFLKPLLGLTGRADKFIAVDEEEELLPYFPPSQRDLLWPFYTGRTRTFVLPGAAAGGGEVLGGGGGPSSSVLGGIGIPLMMSGGQCVVEPSSTTLPDSIER